MWTNFHVSRAYRPEQNVNSLETEVTWDKLCDPSVLEFLHLWFENDGSVSTSWGFVGIMNYHHMVLILYLALHPKGDQSWVFIARTEWSWNSNTLATSCEELTHLKRPWCWEGLGAGGEGDDRGWDGWMASPTQCTWVWVDSRSWWWTGRPGVLRFMGSQRVGHDWATELNWTEHLVRTQ